MGFDAIKGYFKQNRMFYLFTAPLFGTYRNHIMARARRRQGIDGNLVVFSSFDFRSYNDNPRYISEKLHELRPETDIVWLFRDSAAAKKKFDLPPYVRALNSTARDGVEAQARARVTVDNFNKRFYLKFPAEGQIYIQTWHGDRAFKKVGYDNPHQYTRFNRMLEEKCTLGVTGSDYGDMQFRSAFHYKGELMKVGYPRNDILLRTDPAEGRAIRERLHLPQDARLLLYAPTFRDTEQKNHELQKVRLDLNHVLDVLEETTGETWKCLVRAHYMTRGIPFDDGSGRLIAASAHPEMAELLKISDALITDYSSCAGDFALTRRPIWLYQDDLQDYQTNNRALYFDMKDSPYWVAATPEEMDALIRATTPERARENCDAILRFYGEAETGHAAQSVAEYIISKLEPNRKGNQ